MSSPQMLRKDDHAGISELLRANGYPHDKEFVAEVADHAEANRKKALHIQIDDLLETAFRIQRKHIDGDLYFAKAVADMMTHNKTWTSSLQQQVDTAKNEADAHHVRQMDELDKRAGKIADKAARRRGDA